MRPSQTFFVILTVFQSKFFVECFSQIFTLIARCERFFLVYYVPFVHSILFHNNMLMRENVNNEVNTDSSILRFVKLQKACGPDNANITFSFSGVCPCHLPKKTNTCYVSSIVYLLKLET